ncbi:MAG TPA: Fur family transcriptional regulator [Rhizomicrobium sp.]|nr:Fur family transcriptional regulator [Rhizomicrobium sp.]
MASKKTSKLLEEAATRLKKAGLRPTRQRLALASLLFRGGHRHLTAESLAAEAARAGHSLSLATVYNTLNQFTQAGLLREVTVDVGRAWFDTNTGEHQHFYCEDDGTLIDIPGESIAVAGLPAPPRGMAIDRVDVVVRVRAQK